MFALIRHVDLSVKDLETSLVFYRQLLGLLGNVEEVEIVGEQKERVVYLSLEGAYGDGALGLRQATHARSVDRYNIGLHHIAFNAADRDEVDAVDAWVKNKQIVNEGPARPYYSGYYYAVFFRDPDGIKLEVVHRP